MTWKVNASKQTLKKAAKMPDKAQTAFWRLNKLLQAEGPTGPHAWRNYGKLTNRKHEYHCHLTADHQWVACWRAQEAVLVVEIFYAGSHQSAPY
jgi:hypothetical protein